MRRNAATTTNAMIANIAAQIPPITLPLPVECDEMPSSRVKRSGSERTLAPIQYFMIIRKYFLNEIIEMYWKKRMRKDK